MIRFTFCLVILCCCAIVCPATVIDVSTPAQLQNAIDDAAAGDVIRLADGDYRIIDKGGYAFTITDKTNLTIKSLSGNRAAVIIAGQGMTDSEVQHGFVLQNSHHITIQDLTIQNVYYHCIQNHPNVDYLTVRNCVLRDGAEQLLKVAYSSSISDPSEWGLIEGCLFEYSAGVGVQSYMGGIDVHLGENWIIRNNTFKGIRSPESSCAEHAIHMWTGSRNTLVENNIIINCDRGIGFGLGGVFHYGGIIRNNFIYHAYYSGTDFGDVGIGLESSPDTQVYNNTIYFANSYYAAIEYRFSSTTNVYIANNLTNKLIQLRDGASGTVTNNVTNAAAGWFANTATGDLHLKDATISAAIDKGIFITGLTTDIDANARPQGHFPDIGADEFLLPRLRAKVLLEGPYEGSSMQLALNTGNAIPLSSPYAGAARLANAIPANAVDWIKVILRTGTARTTGVDSTSCFVSDNGLLLEPDGSEGVAFNVNAGNNYYIVVRHRNHAAVMSAVTVPVNYATSTFDFTVPANCFGTAGFRLIDGKSVLWAGDVNQDKLVNATDFTLWLTAAQQGQKDYGDSDMDMDGFTTSADYVKWFNNVRSAAGSQVP